MADGTTDEEMDGLRLLRHGLDHINQGISVCDSRLRLVAWNRRFLSMLGFPEEMVWTGTPFESFMRYNAERGEYGPGEVEDLVHERVEVARAFKPHSFERTRPQTGQIIAIRGEPLPGGGFITVYTDITEQRYYEMMIRERSDELDRRVQDRTSALEAANAERDVIAQRLARITDTVPALIAYIGRDQRYTFANQRYADWFGHTKGSIAGLTVAEILGPELYARLGPKVAEALNGHEVSYEYALTRADGRTAHARSTLVPEIGRDGEVVGLFVLSMDVTDQKKAEAALIQAQKMDAVGKLTGGLAHDFNNLLTIVVGNLATLHERLDGKPDAEELLEPALAAARRGVDLTRRLLAFSRQQPLEPVPVEVERLISGLLQLLRRSLTEAVEVVTTFDQRPLYVLADPHQLENALLNLVLNARDAMPEGGRLEIAAAPYTVSAEGEADAPPGDYVAITVRDSGHGMDQATLARAFEPFFTSKEFGSGSGLGLSMVYGFVKQSGGCIRIHSKPGKGTSVLFLLPRGTAPVAMPVQPLRAARLGTERDNRLVLLVEDDREVRKVIRRQLMELGCVVVEAGDGSEAMRLLDSISEVSVLLTDVVMPGGMGGRVLAEAATRRWPGLKVVLMSGYADTGNDLSLPILMKPFTMEQLDNALRGEGTS